MKITFLGGAGEVTGSQHLIETDNLRLLLDCGLFQGQRKETRAKNMEFFCRPKELDGVILSHAHIDHCGNLPGLYRAGFDGTIFCTDATADIADIMLQDAAHIQEEDAKYLNRKRKGGDLIEPLYTSEDAEAVVRQIQPMHFNQWHELATDVRVRFSPAGHILGSAITELEIRERAQWKRIVFTGDLGRYGMPLLVDPQPLEYPADVLIIESTYGNRVHPPVKDMKDDLLRIIQEAHQRGGRVIIPAFSLGRTQQVIYHLNELFNEGRLPRIPIFVDSPLSNRCTAVHRRYQEQPRRRREQDPAARRRRVRVRYAAVHGVAAAEHGAE
jgi:metallo-beta-lactamase family protein